MIGITYHAQDSLGDVTFVELPSVGEKFDQGSVFGVVESVKAASDLYMPVSGEITAVNEELNDCPEKVNSDPYETAWMIRVTPNSSLDNAELLSSENYEKEIG